MAKRKKKKKKRKRQSRGLVRGVVRCYLCNKTVGAGKELAKHVISCHDMSLVKYKKLCPERAPFDVSKHVILADDLFQAQVHKGLTGKWPRWYDPNAPVVFEGAAILADLLLSGFVAHKLEFSMELRFFCMLYAQYLFDPSAIIKAAEDPMIREQINGAMNFLDRLEGTLLSDLMGVLAAIKFKAEASAATPLAGSSRTRFVAAEVTREGVPGSAGTIENLDPERQKDIHAQVKEFASVMQGAGFGGDYHLVEPPSQVEKKAK